MLRTKDRIVDIMRNLEQELLGSNSSDILRKTKDFFTKRLQFPPIHLVRKRTLIKKGYEDAVLICLSKFTFISWMGVGIQFNADSQKLP